MEKDRYVVGGQCVYEKDDLVYTYSKIEFNNNTVSMLAIIDYSSSKYKINKKYGISFVNNTGTYYYIRPNFAFPIHFVNLLKEKINNKSNNFHIQNKVKNIESIIVEKEREEEYFRLKCRIHEESFYSMCKNFYEIINKQNTFNNMIENQRLNTYQPRHHSDDDSANDSSYRKYHGAYGYDDSAIDDAFEGDPENYWNID